MVKLFNIQLQGKFISCDYLPEDSKLCGHIEVNIINKEIKSISYPEGYEWCTAHTSKAKWFLLSLLGSEEIPTEKTLMWC